jgi:hypothetical protein
LSDHDAHLIIFNNVPVPNKTPEFINTRNDYNNNTNSEFQFLLSLELWDNTFDNNFHNNSYVFMLAFQKSELYTIIRISSNMKRIILLSKHSNDSNVKTYFKQYCKILSKIIPAAKELYYNRIIAKSNKKIRRSWKIINEVQGKTKQNTGIHSIVTDNKVVMNQNKIPHAFNRYFLSTVDSIILDINGHTSTRELTQLHI